MDRVIDASVPLPAGTDGPLDKQDLNVATLVIDEGFGTQDTVGRERILDVISAIGDDFEKVLVITHLDDLKEAFPVRIEVLKDESGSTFWIN